MDSNYDKQRAFEDRVGWKNIMAMNMAIGKFLAFEPKITYAACKDGACCYSPDNMKEYFPTPHSQQVECDRYLKEQEERFPNGWVTQEGYATTKLEHYPMFHSDWNIMMEAICRLAAKGQRIEVVPDDIYSTWEAVAKACK